MPGLYTSSYEKDLKTFQDLYTDPYLKPDEIKFYPTSVIPNTELYNLYKKGKYIPLDTKEIQKLIRETFLHIIPPYTRIKRLIRDIPATEIAAGSNITNLSQLTHELIAKELEKNKKIRELFYQRLYGDFTLCKNEKEFLKKISLPNSQFPIPDKQANNISTYLIGKSPDLKSLRAFVSLDTRSREIRHKPKGNIHSSNMIIRTYQSSVGTEYFISAEDQLGYVYGFTRLLLPNEGEAMQVKGLGKATAIIRELHVYGQMESLDQESSSKSIQHVGFGRQLMDIAEQIAHHAHYLRLSVISGIGVKAYYRKLGYKGEGTYMVKKIR